MKKTIDDYYIIDRPNTHARTIIDTISRTNYAIAGFVVPLSIKKPRRAKIGTKSQTIEAPERNVVAGRIRWQAMSLEICE